VDPAQTRVGVQLGHRRKNQDVLQQPGQLLLAALGHEKIPEGVKAFALVGIGDGVPFPHDLFEQRTLGAVPQRDALAHLAIEETEVVLHLAEIGEQLAGHLEELLEPVFEGGVGQHGNVAVFDPGDVRIDLFTPLGQLGNACIRIGLGALAHLPQEFEQGQQARFRPHEGALGQARQPGNRLFGGGGQIEMGFVRSGGIKLAQPPFFVVRPVVEVLLGRFGECVIPQALPQGEQFILQRFHQVGL
jgi:hypothetical protein